MAKVNETVHGCGPKGSTVRGAVRRYPTRLCTDGTQWSVHMKPAEFQEHHRMESCLRTCWFGVEIMGNLITKQTLMDFCMKAVVYMPIVISSFKSLLKESQSMNQPNH